MVPERIPLLPDLIPGISSRGSVLKLFSSGGAAVYQYIDAAQISVSGIRDRGDGKAQFLSFAHSVLTGSLDHLLGKIRLLHFFRSHICLDQTGADGDHTDPLRAIFMSAFLGIPHDKILAQTICQTGFVESDA